ncbi:MAG: hypothetical protein E6H99_02480 [Chloroflexi bacterium]|nr:MAG: hypothetical protein E6H99_02480 [Chloroflexota bacterium]TMG68112.1 MAG: hypothetical protein E6H82_02445 [Chloroflexota bacterium]
MRVFFVFNIFLWVVLFLAWLPYTALMGLADPVSTDVRFILSVTAALLILQGFVRHRRARSRKQLLT